MAMIAGLKPLARAAAQPAGIRSHARGGCPIGLRPGFSSAASGNGRSLSVSIAPGAPRQSSLAAAVPATPALGPVVAPECSAPADTYMKVAASGAEKALLTWQRTFLLAIIAGAFISFGALFALSVGCACPGLSSTDPGLQKLVLGVFGLPLGLILVMATGVELFTGNTMFMAVAVAQGMATTGQLIKNWVASFAGNLVGSFGIVFLMGLTGLTAQRDAAAAVAVAKTSLTFTEALTRGIIANWLVNLAIWIGTSSSSVPGKIIGAIVPVTAFTAMGMEHSVANMSLIPMGLAVSGVTYQQFWIRNLIPVVLGNIIGGAVCMGLALSYAHGKPKAA